MKWGKKLLCSWLLCGHHSAQHSWTGQGELFNITKKRFFFIIATASAAWHAWKEQWKERWLGKKARFGASNVCLFLKRSRCGDASIVVMSSFTFNFGTLLGWLFWIYLLFFAFFVFLWCGCNLVWSEEWTAELGSRFFPLCCTALPLCRSAVASINYCEHV